MNHEVIIAGFGGQGVMSMGMLLAYGGMLENKKVTWMPSYGPEQRGGTANCHVVISDDEVGSPIITRPTALIAMNGPSLDKFEGVIRPGGLAVVNASLVSRGPARDDVRWAKVPANELAEELGSARVANMVALGAFLGLTGAVSSKSLVEGLRKVLPEHRHELIPLNARALETGMQFAASV